MAANRHTPSVLFMGNNAAGPDEMVKALGRTTSVPTPAMDRLYTYIDPAAPPLPEGSAQISPSWRSV